MDNELACVLIFIVILTAALLGLNYTVSNIKCHAKAEALEYQCDYRPMQGCVLIKPNGKKILLEQLREYAE